jgi:hypothetical protein
VQLWQTQNKVLYDAVRVHHVYADTSEAELAARRRPVVDRGADDEPPLRKQAVTTGMKA